MKHAPDMLVDLVTISWDGRAGSFLTKTEPVAADDPEVARVLRSFPMIGVWDDAFLMVECALERMNCQMDLRGFAYHFDEALVNISDGAYSYINLSESAFNRLLLRLFQVLIDGAEQTQSGILQDERWQTFLHHVEEFTAQAQSTDY